VLRDPHQAEDALQETWCRALQHLEGIDAGHLRGWLFTVAYHQAMLFKRRLKTRTSPLTDQLPLADPAAGPASIVEQKDDIARLRQLIEELPAQQKEVLLQRIYEGKRFREIAQQLDCPLNTALARMHDGIKKLRLLWGLEND
jgi:RNA polymerase sigma-70 factor (ECF subfamily)